MAETIVAKRELGNGRWDRALKRNMTELSVADNYEDAKHEWIATGEVWWSGNEAMPDWVRNSKMGYGKCLCGHIVVYHFQITNTENGIVECVGSDHINTYLIMRAIAEDEDRPIETITDAQIQEWIDVRVKSMKAEAWWKANGEAFEMMFNAIKEIDLRYNVHITGEYYDQKTQWYQKKTKLRKRGEGRYASDNYKMASIVWRWNHPDNPKAQINTTGFPNDNLMKDLSLLFLTKDNLIAKMEKEKSRREERIRKLEEKRERERIRKEERRARERAEEAERLRIYNLPENVEKRRLEAEQRERDRIAREAEQKRLFEERQERRRQAEIAKQVQNEEILRDNNDKFENLCGYYDIPIFDETFAQNDWERNFLADIKKQLLKDKPMSTNQLQTLRRIMDIDLATAKQVKYLESLGVYNAHTYTKREASKKIKELLKINELLNNNEGYKGHLKDKKLHE